MKTLPRIAFLQLLSLILAICLSGRLNAQVRIHQQVELNPPYKAKNVNQDRTMGTLLPPLLAGSGFNVYTTRACRITVTNADININWSGPQFGIMDSHSGTVPYLCRIAGGVKTSYSESFDVPPCSGISIFAFRFGAYGYSYASAVVSGNQAVFGTPDDFTATVTATPLPDHEPGSLQTSVDPVRLDATYAGANDTRQSELVETVLDNAGGWFENCCDGVMTFTIQNPMAGVKLVTYDKNAQPIEGNSVDAFFYNGYSARCTVEWNCSDIPGEISTLRIRADAYGVSHVQEIPLIKRKTFDLLSQISQGWCDPQFTDNVSMYYGDVLQMDPYVRGRVDGANMGTPPDAFAFKYNARIADADTLGWLSNQYEYSGWGGTPTASGDTIFNRDIRLGGLMFNAREKEVLSPTNVTLRLEPNVQNVGSGTMTIQVLPSPLIFKMKPAVVKFGDTVTVVVRLKTSPADTVGVELPPYARREFQIIQGESAGYLFSDADPTYLTDYLFVYSPDTIRFIAREITPQANQVDVRIAVCYHDDGDPNYNNYCPPLAGIGKVTISKGSSILLGETKYYYAIKDESGKLQIKETLDPDVGEGITSVIMEDPVIAKDAVNNDKNGVYWDYYKPDGTGLDNGVIRLIGRYWKQDRTYKVTLHGVLPTDGSDASIEIEVKKPDVLGDKKLSPKERHSVVKDVTADPNSSDCNLDLDALIIKYAGENGIPPQIIKGQMLKETGFRPAWRYEPFKDVEYQNEDKRDNYFGEDMYFVVTKSSTGTVSMGTGDWPTTHRNVYSGINTLTVTPYNRDAVTVGYYLSQHWNDYVRHGTGSIPDEIVGGKALTKRWKVLYDIEKTKKQSDAAARQNAHTKLVDELVDPDTKLGGDYDIMAQTRKVTSYGFVQMMYITAADNRFLKNPLGWYEPTGPQYVDQYDEHLYPEKLNEQDFLMPRYCDLLLKNLNFMFTGPIPPSQWITNKGGTTSAGFEAIWKRALQSYNPGEADYGKNVLINADMFKPAK